jgi:hypothetical protein
MRKRGFGGYKPRLERVRVLKWGNGLVRTHSTSGYMKCLVLWTKVGSDHLPVVSLDASLP